MRRPQRRALGQPHPEKSGLRLHPEDRFTLGPTQAWADRVSNRPRSTMISGISAKTRSTACGLEPAVPPTKPYTPNRRRPGWQPRRPVRPNRHAAAPPESLWPDQDRPPPPHSRIGTPHQPPWHRQLHPIHTRTLKPYLKIERNPNRAPVQAVSRSPSTAARSRSPQRYTPRCLHHPSPE